MEIYAEREGNAECAHVTFDERRGLRVTVTMRDGETLVEIEGVVEPLVVVEGLPLTLKVYALP